jgi:propionyl-CoA carboxylase beta chain
MADGTDRRDGRVGCGRVRVRQQLGEAAKKGEDVDALRLELQQDYEDTVNPYIAAERAMSTR